MNPVFYAESGIFRPLHADEHMDGDAVALAQADIPAGYTPLPYRTPAR